MSHHHLGATGVTNSDNPAAANALLILLESWPFTQRDESWVAGGVHVHLLERHSSPQLNVLLILYGLEELYLNEVILNTYYQIFNFFPKPKSYWFCISFNWGYSSRITCSIERIAQKSQLYRETILSQPCHKIARVQSLNEGDTRYSGFARVIQDHLCLQRLHYNKHKRTFRISFFFPFSSHLCLSGAHKTTSNNTPSPYFACCCCFKAITSKNNIDDTSQMLTIL